MTSIKQEVNKGDDDGVEIIRLDIENDNQIDEPKIKTEAPKTAKDLFSDFKPDSASEGEQEDEESEDEEDDDEPLAKRAKKDNPKPGRKKKEGTNLTPNNKKVVCVHLKLLS